LQSTVGPENPSALSLAFDRIVVGTTYMFLSEKKRDQFYKGIMDIHVEDDIPPAAVPEPVTNEDDIPPAVPEPVANDELVGEKMKKKKKKKKKAVTEDIQEELFPDPI
jgi:hypothetical protein